MSMQILRTVNITRLLSLLPRWSIKEEMTHIMVIKPSHWVNFMLCSWLLFCRHITSNLGIPNLMDLGSMRNYLYVLTSTECGCAVLVSEWCGPKPYISKWLWCSRDGLTYPAWVLCSIAFSRGTGCGCPVNALGNMWWILAPKSSSQTLVKYRWWMMMEM